MLLNNNYIKIVLRRTNKREMKHILILWQSLSVPVSVPPSRRIYHIFVGTRSSKEGFANKNFMNMELRDSYFGKWLCKGVSKEELKLLMLHAYLLDQLI